VRPTGCRIPFPRCQRCAGLARLAVDQKDQLVDDCLCRCRLGVQFFGGGGSLLCCAGALLGHLVHAGHGDVDLLNALGLLVRCDRDLVVQFGHLGDSGDDRLDGFGAFLRTGDGVLDQDRRFLGCLTRALSEIAHLLRDNREALAVFAGASGFNGCIQGKKVGLERDFLDHLDDAVDLVGGFVDLGHRPIALVGDLACLAGQLAGFPCVAGVGSRDGRHMLKRAGGLFE